MNIFSARMPAARSAIGPSALGVIPLVLLLLVIGATGCSPRMKDGLQLTSYRDPYFPETYELKPDTCVYRKDRSGDYHILVHSVRSGDDTAARPVEQWMHVHIYWRPKPGKTVDDPSSLDATLTYVVASGETKTSYTGSAFAFPEKARYSDELSVRIEGARMTPSGGATDGDMLGATRVLGKVQARSDAAASVDLQRQMQIMLAGIEGR